MTSIKQDDLIESVAAALQFISFYHPADYITHLARAFEIEKSDAARDAIAQILTNSRMCAEGKRPICQDTGIVNVYLDVGMDVRWEGFKGSVDDAVNEGVRRAYLDKDNLLRASVVADPQFDAQEHARQHPRGDPRPDRSRRYGRRPDRRQGRRVGEQVEAGDAEPVRFGRRLGAQDGADDGRRLVPAGHARHRHRRHRREGDADGEGVADGAARHERAARARAVERARGTAHRALREGQCAGHRRAGTGRPDDGARRQDRHVPHARRQQAGGDDPELRGDAPRALRARRQRPGVLRAALARPLAEGRLDSRTTRSPAGSTSTR